MALNSKKLLNYIGIPILALVLLIIFYSNLVNRWKGVDVYLPEGYSGDVTIVFNEPSGELIDQVFSRNIIRIPESGTFVTREGAYFVTAPKKFYFATGEGTMVSLEEIEVATGDQASDAPSIYCLTNHEPMENGVVKTTFSVGVNGDSCDPQISQK